MTIDVTRLEGSWSLCFKAICMWSIHDFPAYGLFARCHVKGYMACPLCGPDVDTQHSSHLKKNVYQGHRHYLGIDHPYWRDRVSFNGRVEHRVAPTRVLVVDIMKRVEKHEEWLSRRISTRTHDDKENPIHTHGVKRKNTFFCLPYWQVWGWFRVVFITFLIHKTWVANSCTKF